MSFRRLVPYLTFLAVLAMAIRPSIDTDTWWHLRAGESILDHRQILRQDVFSFTMPGAAWEYPGWLAEIAMAAIRRAAGLAGLSAFTAVFVVLGLAFLWPLLEGPLLLRSFVLLLAAATSAIYWSARPQIITFALTGATLYLMDRAIPRWPAAAWVLPALLALWANLHGGFAIGLILIAATFLGEVFEAFVGDPARGLHLGEAWQSRRGRLARIAGLGVVCALAVGVNPFGLSMLAYPWKTVSIGTLQSSIQEWQSPDFHTAAVQPFLVMLIGLLASVAGSSAIDDRRRSPPDGGLHRAGAAGGPQHRLFRARRRADIGEAPGFSGRTMEPAVPSQPASAGLFDEAGESHPGAGADGSRWRLGVYPAQPSVPRSTHRPPDSAAGVRAIRRDAPLGESVPLL